jgi:hypothetical protein
MRKFLKIRKLQILIIAELVLLVVTKSPKICREIEENIVKLEVLVG